MKKYDKLTFVSRSDTCRAPMAEALMQDNLLLEDIISDSRGMIVLFPEPINPKAEEILVQNGLTMQEHQARPLTKDDFDSRTLIFTMEAAQKQKILEEYADAAINVYSLAEYCGETGDVESPLGKDLPEYGACFQRLKDLTEKLAAMIREENQ
ncbi:MAG: phosphotyrosine protein phosphatase [Eubacteriales bacterium]|nr:phosphotyrosine protein phosphatase [Eubacteriales bacterium]